MSRYQYPTASSLTWRWVAALTAGVPLCLLIGFGAVKLWSAAGSDCEVFEAGSRLGSLFLTWPALSLTMWVAFAATVSILRSRIAIGIIVGLVVAVGIGTWFVSGTAGMIRSNPELSSEVCPSGTPDWWPGWLPQSARG
jgi:hypothetical protein